MSLKRNILANYVSQFYVTLVGLVMVPVYIRYMGVEAYGLVGFFAMVQVGFQLLDMGLVPTVAREAARFGGGAISALRLRQLLRALEGVFLLMAIIGSLALILSADLIASKWLRAEQLRPQEVAHAIELMALAAGLRWVSELYRGVISGFEHMVWLGKFNVAVATARFVLVVPVFFWIGTGPGDFFSFQLLVALVELAVVARMAYGLLPTVPFSALRWSWQPLREVMSFSLGMAAATLTWVLVGNTDKLLLSTLLSLTDYGRFSLAVLVASGVVLMASPVGAALMPRLTVLHSRHDDAAFLDLYRQATQWVGLLVWPTCAMLAFNADRVLWLWTGDAALAAQAAPTLRLYALGNGLLAVGAFPYYLQFARGQLRLHLWGTGLFVLLLVPLLVGATRQFGTVGAGWTWLLVNLVYFVLWIPFVHGRLCSGLHLRWLLHDVMPIAALAFLGASVTPSLPWPELRALAGLQLLAVCAAVLLASALGSEWFRAECARRWLELCQQCGA